MKKLLTLLIVSILLVGCGNQSKEETKTCTISEDQSGVTLETTFTAIDDEINKIGIRTKLPNIFEAMGIDVDDITDEQKQMIEKEMMKEFDIKDLTGIDLQTSYSKENIVVEMTIDLNHASDKILDELNIDKNNKNSLKKVIKDAEAEGFKCR